MLQVCWKKNVFWKNLAARKKKPPSSNSCSFKIDATYITFNVIPCQSLFIHFPVNMHIVYSSPCFCACLVLHVFRAINLAMPPEQPIGDFFNFRITIHERFQPFCCESYKCWAQSFVLKLFQILKFWSEKINYTVVWKRWLTRNVNQFRNFFRNWWGLYYPVCLKSYCFSIRNRWTFRYFLRRIRLRCKALSRVWNWIFKSSAATFWKKKCGSVFFPQKKHLPVGFISKTRILCNKTIAVWEKSSESKYFSKSCFNPNQLHISIVIFRLRSWFNDRCTCIPASRLFAHFDNSSKEEFIAILSRSEQ